jgi:hypothetical protein
MSSKKILLSKEPKDVATMLYKFDLDKSSKGNYLCNQKEVAKEYFLQFPLKGVLIDDALL